MAGEHSQQFIETTAVSPNRSTVAASGFSTSSAKLPSASVVASANAAIRSGAMFEPDSSPLRSKPTSAEPETSASSRNASAG